MTILDRVMEARSAATLDQPRPHAPTPEPQARAPWPWHGAALGGILLLAAGLNLWSLSRNGYGNQYYAAAVLSMLQNWHNFFFVSFDPGGFVSIDKPPLGFWVQAASARLLGFSGLSILLPEAVAGVGSVAVLYALVRRAFGRGTGLLAALMLAITPVSVSVSRNNTIDSLLVFTLLLSVWTVLRAAERGSLKWLLATGAIVGLGFEIKMLEAYLVVPALGLVYLMAAPRRWLTRIGHLGLASVVMLAVSFAWPVAVDLTPASQRPWVDSTQDNSAVNLALGYNGIQRLLGRGATLSAPSGQSSASNSPAAAGFGSGGSGPGGQQENGSPSPLRLIDQQLGGQASWLLGLAAAGLVITGTAAWRARKRLSSSRRGQAFLVFGMWLLTAGAFFSVAEYFHSYYLVTLGPPIAALAGIGTVGAWRAFRTGGRLAWLLPAALVAAGAVQAWILAPFSSGYAWLTPVAVGGGVLSAAVLAGVWAWQRFAAGQRATFRRVAGTAAALGVAALLVTPGVWAAMPAMGIGGGMLPSAGPNMTRNGGFPGGGTSSSRRGGQPGPGGQPADPQAATDPQAAPDAQGGARGSGGPFGAVDPSVIAYLEANQGSATYLVATPSSMAAAPIILATGKPVMPLGGFLGSDPILTTQQFTNLVQTGVLRYVLEGGGGPGGRGNTGITTWVQQNCTPVSGAAQLYDCAAAA
jgi:4-amino-4-deoxy-L-arabinose transferase-like glycosyltransferase